MAGTDGQVGPRGWLQLGHMTLSGGRQSSFKIDSDMLSDREISSAASLLARILPPFSSIEGVPRGGLRLAYALRMMVESEGPVLLVDDVWTTGGSMEAHRDGRDAIGAVLFARGPVAPWVTALFTLHDGLWLA